MVFQRYKISTGDKSSVAFATELMIIQLVIPGCEPKDVENLCWLATGIRMGSNPGLHACVKQAIEFIYEGVTVEHDGQEDLDMGILLPKSKGGVVS